MWHINVTAKTMTWYGGTSFTHVNFNEEAKTYLKNGYTAIFTMSVPFEVRMCRSYWEGVDSQGNKMNRYIPGGCWNVPFRAGTYEVSGWAYDPLCGEQIGFRAVPEDAAPWDETPTCVNCVWPFPKASSVPVYQDPAIQPVIPANQPVVVNNNQTVNNPPVVQTNYAPDVNFWRNVGGWALVVLACLAGLALLALAIFGIVKLIQWIVKSLRKPAVTTKSKTVVRHPNVVAAMKEGVSGLTTEQAELLIEKYPTKDMLAKATRKQIMAIPNIHMGWQKADKVLAWAKK